MKIAVCQDSYKGTLPAEKVVEIIKEGLEEELEENCEIKCFPLADGGEGTSKIITQQLGGKIHRVPLDPKYSLIKVGEVGMVGNQAFIDVASASGLPKKITVTTFLESSSYGTGELINYAFKKGCQTINLCLGGSGINDGGIGVLRVFGVRFLDEYKKELEPRTKNLSKIHTLDFTGFEKCIKQVQFKFLTDVQNPLIGSAGTTHVFGRQKGANDQVIQMVEEGMKNYITVLQQAGFSSKHLIPGVGAAGGISYSMATIIGGDYQSGIEFIFRELNLKDVLAQADVLIVGEGRYDFQTAMGKVVEGVLNLTKELNLLRILLAGALQWNYWDIQNPLIDFVQTAITENQTPEEILERAEKNLYSASRNVGRILSKIG